MNSAEATDNRGYRPYDVGQPFAEVRRDPIESTRVKAHMTRALSLFRKFADFLSLFTGPFHEAVQFRLLVECAAVDSQDGRGPFHVAIGGLNRRRNEKLFCLLKGHSDMDGHGVTHATAQRSKGIILLSQCRLN